MLEEGYVKGARGEYGKEIYGEDGKRLKKQFKTITEIDVSRFSFYDFNFYEQVFIPYALDLSNMQLTDITPIKVHPHLAFLRLSNNRLTNKSLKTLKYMENLVSLYLTKNYIISTTLPRLEKLQQLNLDNNPIKEIGPIDQPNLQILILNNTKISELQYIGYDSTPKLLTLSACHCSIKNMVADYAFTMQHLYLSYNEIRRIDGLQGLINLKILHLRNNKISKLGGLGVGLEKLEYLNLRENEIVETNELKIVKFLHSLREIILTDNPVDDEMGRDIRYMVLMYSLELRRVNKEVTDDTEVEYARSLIYEVEAEEDDIFIPGEGYENEDNEFQN